ncbi:CLUMA_CG019578, isoform A [Clunio marinus]|uniref:CLUMA_CG019578, isoform A n=1 Tax=Clunio marinus TaxID=568069 RepID=A0A1J1J2J3_9DIPT|nr:CLUMA_CG019578, isoform A [Clunio marinus]
MAANSVLLDFSIEPARIIDELSRKDIVKVIKENIEKYFGNLKMIYDMLVNDGYLCILSDNTGVIFSLRFYNEGLITLNIEYFKKENQPQKISFENLRVLEISLRLSMQAKRSKFLPAIKRGGIDVYLTSSGTASRCFPSSRLLENTLVKDLSLLHGQSLPTLSRGPIIRFFQTSDERIIEYDIDKVLFDKHSEFQKIQIVHSKQLGNMLILDELQNIAEADLIYTETLMQRGKENYSGKEICILGGGDGALLYELLKENPKHVVMLEIDDLVMEACNKHMSSICGDVLEVRQRENYEIVIGDCMVWLEKYIKEGKKFDYVFGDLTDIPISDTPTGEIWDFIRKILESSFKVLKPTGKFMTHGNGASCPESLEMYEEQLKKLKPVVKFTRDTAFIPSFMENWIFYQVGLADQ